MLNKCSGEIFVRTHKTIATGGVFLKSFDLKTRNFNKSGQMWGIIISEIKKHTKTILAQLDSHFRYHYL